MHTTLDTPSIVQDGLAVYDLGQGEPLLLMAYPHAYTLQSTAESPLAARLLGLGRRLITFDPPGAFQSTRPADLTMAEMLSSAKEALDLCAIRGPVDILGHSMGGLCALSLALERPDLVRRLVLLCSVSGGPAVQRCRGLPWFWRPTDPDFWRFIAWGLQLGTGRGSLAMHKRLVQLIRRVSFHEQSCLEPVLIETGDEHRPAPVRDRWPMYARKLDYQERLENVQSPTLVIAGSFDPQAPVACSEELAAGIPNAELFIFEGSGHYPFIEEPEAFDAVVGSFLAEPLPE